MNADSGELAGATQEIVGGLSNGLTVDGVLVVVTNASARVFKPPSAKGAHKSWDDFLCYSASICKFEAHTSALVGLFGDGTAKAFSLPGLKEIVSVDVSNTLDLRRIAEAMITPTGFIFGWKGPSEVAALNIWGTHQDLYDPQHQSFAVTEPAQDTITRQAFQPRSSDSCETYDLEFAVDCRNYPCNTSRYGQA